jgi:hypothetical protein
MVITPSVSRGLQYVRLPDALSAAACDGVILRAAEPVRHAAVLNAALAALAFGLAGVVAAGAVTGARPR